MQRNMEYVYEVYREQSFSKAAKKLFISQPALSAIVKKTEEKLQMPIFDRSTTPIRLTEAGKLYIRSAEKIMAIESELEESLSGLRDSVKGVINIGSAAFFCVHVLPEIIQNFRNRHADCKINLIECNAPDLSDSLQSGLLDIILDVETLDPRIFTSVLWKREHIILAVPSDNRINTGLRDYVIPFSSVQNGDFESNRFRPISLSGFKDEQFLLLKKGNDMYRRALHMCKNAGFTPNISMSLDQLLTSYYLAKDGVGIAFVRASITQYVEPTDKLCFYKIDDESAIRGIMISRRKNSAVSKQEELFTDYLLSCAQRK
ncbi:MAG: LysR family transcriptional regulator [Synergistaceae bacterium]